MRAAELHDAGPAEWDALIAGEQNVWGPGEELSWAGKTRHVGVLEPDGAPIALAGAVAAEVAVGEERFPVVGIGGVIVTQRLRGQGLARLVIEAIMELAAELGPDRAMLFCGESNVGLYSRFGFAEIEAPVSAEQPSGRITMPMRAMWAPLRAGAQWPAGDVEVLGLPF